MNDEFEKYLQQNRERFENGSPSPRVWEKLKSGLEEHQARRARIVRMRRISLGIAASLVLCIAITLVLFKNKGQASRNAIARNRAHRDSILDMEKIVAQKIEQDNSARIAGITDNKTRQSLYHYTRLIETRQQQMAVLQQVDPDLYARSQKVLVDLNQVYNRLQKQLPQSPDQQKVLKALIQNLKMQEQILNNQLQLLEELPNDADNAKKAEKI